MMIQSENGKVYYKILMDVGYFTVRVPSMPSS